ncbi:hypothetical protein EAH68_09735 [Corynebacterium hylobatis]|uniref:Uncharacterized protein n=1 Tax=Corynebacterium hylobatis TaxID=1859290 RepID=A0A3S0AVQ8_9CORY|nr:hypothetical protein [Corynebacterium hylobatis]RSZ62409.1 hypothetical protein EAH68_09735 [Corynebacterium hylobatis]
MEAINQFVLTAPLWLQVPLVMVLAVPLATVAAVALVRVVDTVSLAGERAWQAATGPDRVGD